VPRNDPRPIAALVRVVGLWALGLAVWWAAVLPEAERTQRLLALAEAEAARLAPPRALLEQPPWLVAHRLPRLQGMVVLLVLGALIGVGEGAAWRAQDLRAGWRLKLWTIGVVGLGGLCSLLGAYLVVPWPLPHLGVALGLAGYMAVVGFLLMAGRPTIL
jgi:hypothetical protein